MNTAIRRGQIHAPDDIICHCAQVSRSEVLTAIAMVGSDLDALSNLTGAGQTCGGCTPLLGQLAGQDTMQTVFIADKEQLDDAHWRIAFAAPGLMPAGMAAQDIALEIPLGGRGHTRSYTVTAAREGRVEITIRREANGLVSRWLCDEAGPEHFIRMSAPFGGLAVSDGTRPVFLACGIGITPALSFTRVNPDTACQIIWWVRGAEAPGLLKHVQHSLRGTRAKLEIIDTSADGKRLGATAADWMRATLAPGIDHPHLCGPQGFIDTATRALDAIEWPKNQRKVASFLYNPGQGAVTGENSHHKLAQFKLPQDAVTTPSFSLRAATGLIEKLREARAFLAQFYHEIGASQPFEDRLETVTRELRRTGTYAHTSEELAFGARLAWRNSNRCIGRFFWQSLTVRDRRDLDPQLEGYDLARVVFRELVRHVEFGTNGGDLRPSITVFPPDRGIFVENGQLILYAGYEQPDGSVRGDPKNIALTKRAQALGWCGDGSEFDILPLLITIAGVGPFLFEMPRTAITEVPLSHPEVGGVADLGLKWFALPAVANMALDLGGVVYGAAPSNGFYMGTEIGSFNLADPRRYDKIPAMADALGLETGETNPLWRDQALLELNRAVMHSFRQSGVRILDHHALSTWFDRFRTDETERGRPVFGHWPWIVPPMSANLSNIWHDPTLKNVILKPGYFYQSGDDAQQTAHR